MSNKNSADCNSASECDYYSECWEESSFKDLVDSDSERDLYLCCHQSFSCSSSEGKSKLSETVLISESNKTNFKNDCKNRPLLQVQKLTNTRDVKVESSLESVLHFKFEDYPSRTYACDGSCQDTLCLHFTSKVSRVPHVITAEKSVKQPKFHTIRELCQKQEPADYLVTSSHKKSVQASFPFTETEVLENTEGKRFKRSLVRDEVNKTLVRKPIIFHRDYESTCGKNETSSQLKTEHLDYSSKTLDKTASPQIPGHLCSCSSSGDLIISLTLEAAYSTDSLPGDITTLEAKGGSEDTRKHSLAFNFNGSEQKWYISIPKSVHLNTESVRQTIPCAKQKGLLKILVNEASQPLSTQAESSSSDFYPDQVPSTLKPQALSQSPSSFKNTHVIQYPHFFVRSFPHHKVISTDKISEVERNQRKAFRPMKSIVFPKNKQVHKYQKIRNKPYSSSKFHWQTTWDDESINQCTRNYKTVQELEINELYYVPKIITCHCSPLLDLSVKLNSEKPLSINRKLHKRTRGAKVTPRFSSQCLLNHRSHFGSFHYISPTRRKNNLKMQSILNDCLRCTGRQNRHERSREEAHPTVDSSKTRGNGLFTPHLSTYVRSTAPLLSSLGNSPILLPHAGSVPNEKRHSPIPCPQRPAWHPATLYSLPNERRHSPASCLQAEKYTYPVALYSLPNGRCSPASCLQTEKENWHHPDGQCSSSPSPCANIVNVMKPPNKRNMYNTNKVDSEAAQMTYGDLTLKKLLVCPCGSVPQHSLFPNGDISQSVSTKARKSPDINKRTRLTKSDAVNPPRGTFNTMETCCSKCHRLFPSHSSHSICRQDILRSQFTKAQSYFENGFPMKNLKEGPVHKCKEVNTGERKHVKIHARPGTSQNIHPLSSFNDGDCVPKYAVYEPKYCSCCPAIVKQHPGTSREAPASFSSKHKLLENCSNRQQAFLAEPCKGTRTWCTCSQEIPLFCVDQTDTYERGRAALDSEATKIHHRRNRHDKNHWCCKDKTQCSRLL